MIVVTTPYLAGHRIVESKGMVFGLVVRSRGLGGNLMASLRSLGGGEIHEYTSLLEDTRRQALDRLVQNATLLGANAVLSMRFDSSELSGTMSEIVAYGTAVVVAPDAIDGARRTPGRMSWGFGARPPPRPRRRADDGRWPGWPSSRFGGGPRTITALWPCSASASPSSSATLIERVRYRSEAADRVRRADRARRRRTARRPARAAVPAQRRGLHRPDVGSADARLARSGQRRAAVRRGGLTVGACYPRRPGRPSSATPIYEGPNPADGRDRPRRTRPTRPTRGPAAPPSHDPRRRRRSRT